MSASAIADQPLPPITSAPETPASWEWLLGPLGRERLPIKRVLVGVGIYFLSDIWRHVAALLGHADFTEVHWLAMYDTLCGVGFYAAMRSGVTQRFKDPAMTGAQCAAGIVSVAASYVIMPDLRGSQLSVITSALLFTAFMGNPMHCRIIGWLSLLAVAAAMLWSSLFRQDSFHIDIEFLNFAVSAVAMPLVAMIASQLCRNRNDLKLQRRELRAAMERIEMLAICDELTGLPNRRRALELIRLACDTADRTGMPLSFGYLDIDHFKRINDTLGHAAGDQVLRLVAEIAAGELRDGDLLARWGGEEFLLILPVTGAGDARLVIDRLRQRLADNDMWNNRPDLKVTFSAGAATRVRNEAPEQTLERADQALYRAKAAGRGCTMLAEPSTAQQVAEGRSHLRVV